jgi:CheY-like chemotaxis protein/nitrogen-specific signal transduction histidine kinase
VLPGGSPGVVCYFRDIANEVATRRTLEEADRKKDEFIATLSHELRNPLSSIANAAEMLGTPELDAAGRQWAAQVVQRQAVAMGMLLEDLLDISRLTLGRLVMKKQPVTLATVIESALEATRPMIELAKHTLAITMPPASVAVDGDPLRLSQVISNLLSNASKYTDPGGMIKLDVDVLPTEVVVCVKDNGIGMDAASLEHIFEMFSQADGMSERGGGLGIGLALVRGIVELHGGWVRAKSEGLGRGSTFSIGLPRVAGGAHDAAHNTSGVPRPGAIAPQRILVVDDNTDAAEALSNVLELYGHDTRFATSGPQALAELEHFKPQIAVLDIGMPHMNGYEVARRFRATDEGQRMLLFAATGWGQEKDKAMAKEAGFDRHLTKPVAVEKLLALIEEASHTQG